MFPYMFYVLCLLLSGGLLYAEDIKIDESIVSSSSNTVCAFTPQHSLIYFTLSKNDDPSISLMSCMPVIDRKGNFKAWQLEGLLHEDVTLDYQEKVKNPLYGSTIAHVILLENRPVVVPYEHPQSLYYLQALGATTSLFSAPKINDALGKQSAGIVRMCAGVNFSHVSKNISNYIVAVVKSSTGEFGHKGSGFALIKLNSFKEEIKEEQTKDAKEQQEPSEKKERDRFFLDVLNAGNGQSKENKALDITECTDVFSMQGGLDCFESNAVDIHWEPRLGRYYIAVSIKTKSSATDDQGVCALASATIYNDALVLKPLAYHRAIKGNKNIIGATGPDAYVSLHKVRTLATSTGLHYVIVVGGNGKSEQTKRTVAALPLLIAENVDVLAAKNSSVTTVYRGKPAMIYDHREFVQAAEMPEQLCRADESAAMVGGGKPLPTDIVDIAIVQDAVYVTVEKSEQLGESGIYHSQPIFDGNGAIAAWTPWQRVITSNFSIIGMDFNPTDGSFLFLEKDDNETNCHIMMKKTAWKQPVTQATQQQTLDTALSTFFNPEEGGIQGLFDIPAAHEALQHSSLVIATGYKKVAVAQTGCMINGSCKALQEPIVHYFSDAVLDELGPISAATIAHDGKQAWLFVAGAQGVAVLCNADGSGWSFEHGLADIGECASMSFKKFGNFWYVQKLMADGTNLTILSQSKLERVDLRQQDKCSRELLADSMALASTYPPCFYDAVVSDECRLLATSQGLFCATVNDSFQWRAVSLPIEEEQVTRLFVVSPTGFEQGFSKNGQIYVLTQSLFDKSHVYRFYCSNATLTQLPDHFTKQRPYDYFCSFGSLKNQFITDGSVYMHGQNRRITTQADVSFLPEGIVGGKNIQSAFGKRALVNLEKSEMVTAIARNSATGGWMIAGDFGLRITQ